MAVLLLLIYCAIAAYWMVILALAPMFAALSLLTGNETFQTISETMLQPWCTFLIGAAILILSQVVLSYGMRFYLTVNKWTFILAMASTVFMIVVLAMSSREIANWLQSHRLDACVDVLAQHDVTWDDLGDLDDEDLRKMGLETSERRRLLQAIAVDYLVGGGEPRSSAVIDPSTHRPAGLIDGVAVRAPSCLVADALTKIAMISGTDAVELLEQYEASALLVSADGDIQITSDWHHAVHLAA